MKTSSAGSANRDMESLGSGSGARRAASPTRLLVRLLRDSLGFPVRFALAAASIGVLGLSQIYLTWIVKVWADGPLESRDPAALGRTLIEVGIILLGVVVALPVSRYLITSVNQELVRRLRDRALERILALELTAVRRLAAGDIIARFLSDAGALSAFLETVVRRAIREVTVAVGSIVMLFVLDWQLALTICGFVPIVVVLLARVGRVIRRWRSLAQAEIGTLGATIDEQIHGLRGGAVWACTSRRLPTST